ncbi:MAG: biotin transporter BioY [Candidatus Limnocylindria bacterium]
MTAHPLVLVSLVPTTLLARALLAVAGSLLIALAAQVTVPLPFSPVPVTGQTFAVLLIGAAFGARLGAATVGLYIAEGVAGLPVFAPGGPIGPARLLGPTGGYLVGFVVAAYVVGALAERGWDRRLLTAALAMLVGEVAIYAFGLAGLARFVPADRLLAAGLLPFVPGDLAKLALAAAALPTAWHLIGRTR